MRWRGTLCQTRPHHFCYRPICGSPVLWVQAPNPCLRASVCGLHLLPGLLSLCALPRSLSSSWPGFFSSLGHTLPPWPSTVPVLFTAMSRSPRTNYPFRFLSFEFIIGTPWGVAPHILSPAEDVTQRSHVNWSPEVSPGSSHPRCLE